MPKEPDFEIIASLVLGLGVAAGAAAYGFTQIHWTRGMTQPEVAAAAANGASPQKLEKPKRYRLKQQPRRRAPRQGTQKRTFKLQAAPSKATSDVGAATRGVVPSAALTKPVPAATARRSARNSEDQRLPPTASSAPVASPHAAPARLPVQQFPFAEGSALQPSDPRLALPGRVFPAASSRGERPKPEPALPKPNFPDPN